LFVPAAGKDDHEEMTMDKTTSADGTRIAYEKSGDGPAIVFVTGAFNDHTRLAPLAAALSGDHTAVVYDRRGRGESGDGPAYAIHREIEDLAAVIDAAGGRASVFGYSSGAVLALLAATELPIDHLFLFEAPFAAPGRPQPADLAGRMQALIDDGRPGEAVALFQAERIGLPQQVIEQIRQSPMWPGLVAMAQATVYDATITAELAQPTAEMAAVTVPTTVMVGAETMPVLKEAARLILVGEHIEVAGGVDHDVPVGETARLIRVKLSVNNP
jgi:pimeloyl-ACP methyl ester carboxylesterase